MHVGQFLKSFEWFDCTARRPHTVTAQAVEDGCGQVQPACCSYMDIQQHTNTHNSKS